MALLSMCIQLMQEQIMDKIAWVMAEIGMSNSNSNEEMVKVTKMDRLKQTPADMTGNELDFNVKRRKNNMNKNQGNLFKGIDKKTVRRWENFNLFTYVICLVTHLYKETKWFEIADFYRYFFPKNIF